MAYKTKLRLTGRPSREPGGIIIDQFKIEIIPVVLNPVVLNDAPQNRKRPKVNAVMMADGAEPPAADVPTEVAPIPTESPVGELDSRPIPTESPVGELESIDPPTE
jgi:hypothetical protein